MLPGVATLLLRLWLELVRVHPQVWRQHTAHILHIHVAAHRHQRGIVGGSLPGVELESDNPACHAVLGLAEDADATAERLTTSPQTPFMFRVLRVERDLVVEIVATNL